MLCLVGVRQPALPVDLISTRGSPNRGRFTEPPERKQASLSHTVHMVSSAPAFGLTPSEKKTLVLITDHPMIPREHLVRWLGVSERGVSQVLHNLVSAWDLIERRGRCGAMLYTLSEGGIRYMSHRDRAQLPTTRGIWSTEHTTYNRGRRRHLGQANQARRRGDLVPVEAGGRGPGNLRQRTGVVHPYGQDRQGLQLGSRPSPQTPWGSSSLTACTSPSTWSTSCAPVIAGES